LEEEIGQGGEVLKVLVVLVGFLLASCQDLPKDYRGEEGKKRLERYRNQFLEGVVLLDDRLKDRLPKGDYFLILAVRKPDDPQPVAVLRVKNPEFPYRFRITGRHKIRRDELIEGDLVLSARVSGSPTAEVKEGDIVGSASAKAGEKEVKITLSSEIQR